MNKNILYVSIVLLGVILCVRAAEEDGSSKKAPASAHQLEEFVSKRTKSIHWADQIETYEKDTPATRERVTSILKSNSKASPSPVKDNNVIVKKPIPFSLLNSSKRPLFAIIVDGEIIRNGSLTPMHSEEQIEPILTSAILNPGEVKNIYLKQEPSKATLYIWSNDYNNQVKELIAQVGSQLGFPINKKEFIKPPTSVYRFNLGDYKCMYLEWVKNNVVPRLSWGETEKQSKAKKKFWHKLFRNKKLEQLEGNIDVDYLRQFRFHNKENMVIMPLGNPSINGSLIESGLM